MSEPHSGHTNSQRAPEHSWENDHLPIVEAEPTIQQLIDAGEKEKAIKTKVCDLDFDTHSVYNLEGSS